MTNSLASSILHSYQFVPFAEMSLHNNHAIMKITNSQIAQQVKGIYAWVYDEEIVRIGSSKDSLEKRILGHGRWIEMRLQGITKVSNPERVQKELADAQRWRSLLENEGSKATVWGRSGTIVTSPIGELNIYLAEENKLLERHKPPLNNSFFR